MTAVPEHRTRLIAALALALCLIAGSAPRLVGDGAEYLAQALNFASLNRPSLGRQAIGAIERRVGTIDPALAAWSIEQTSVAGADRRRDFLHFWFYALLATPFVWMADVIGISPLNGFTALNLLLVGLALHLVLPRAGAAATTLLVASPLVWWLDKAHTEVFTVALLAIAIVSLRERPWWALVASGAAATQNPPLTIVALLVGVAVLVERGWAFFTDRRLLAAAVVGGGLAVLQPIYTYVRHGTPSLLLYATRPGFPTGTELAASVFDPSIGLIGNFPIFLIATATAAVWLAVRHPRTLTSATSAVAVASAAVFLYAFAQTSNPHHGGTPSLTRYALWFIPLSLAVWMPWRQVSGRLGQRVLAVAAVVSAFGSLIAFHPGVPQNAREPTRLASWLWTQHAAWNNPLPEVFAETLAHVEGTRVPMTSAGCAKILLASRGAGEPVWPIPCLPAPLPPQCQVTGTLCYANRRGGTYDFVVAPGRDVAVIHDDDAAWPAAAEAHVRRVYLDTDWPALVARPAGAVTLVRAWHDLRATTFGDDDRFLLVIHPTGEAPMIHLRSTAPLRGAFIAPTTGTILASLAFDGDDENLWHIAVPGVPGEIVLLTMQQHTGTATE
ncbi:MAG: hypothetical protein ABS36_15255 [Acidobacteria bacterium SCN 69-37]|nr:MAG: hypothetical protein ABS36_15255 [Acidobacteria bacterium SCN 69-37]